MSSDSVSNRPGFPAAAGWCLSVLGVVAVTAYVYAPVLDNDWIRYDNYRVVHGHPGVSQPTVANIFSNEPYRDQAILYQPLIVLSLAIDYRCFGPQDKTGWAWHSLLLHLLVMLLLLGLLYRLTDNLPAAAIGTLLVAAHPLLVETTTWIICRTFLLAGFWIILGSHLYLSYLRRPRWWLLLAQILCYSVSMFAKPLLGIVLLPLLLDLWKRRRITPAVILEKVPVFLVALAFVLINVRAVASGEGPLKPLVHGWPVLLQRAFQGTLWTLANVAIPDKLTIFYQYNGVWQVIGWRAFAVSIGVIAWIVLVIAGSRRFGRELLLSGLAWLLIFLPQLGAIKYRDALTADRYAYVPLWFLGLGLAAVIARLLNPGTSALQPRRTAGYTLTAFLGILTVCGAYISHRQALRWEDEINLWKDVVAQTPGAIPYGAMANVYIDRAQEANTPERKKSQYELAAEAFRQATIQEPGNFQAWGQLGAVYRAINRPDESIAALKHAIEIYPDMPRFWTDLGSAYSQKQQFDKAVECYDRACRLDPKDYKALTGSASALLKLNRPEEALARSQAALTINPYDERSLWIAAQTLAARNRWRDALAVLERLDRLRPGSPQVSKLMTVARQQLSQSPPPKP